MPAGKLNEREHTELLMLYKNTIDDIDRTKKEQWTQFYAVLLAQAAVVGFSRNSFISPSPLTQYEFIWFALLALLLLGWTMIALHQIRLWHLRNLIEEFSKGLEKKSQDLRDTKPATARHRLITPILMGAVLWAIFYFLTIVTKTQITVKESSAFPCLS